MWWALPIAMSAANIFAEKERQDNLQRYNEGQAEVTRYSPWTGMRGQIQRDTGPGIFGAGVSGGVSGLALSQQFGDKNPDTLKTTDKGIWGGNDYSSPSRDGILDFDKYRMNRFSRTA